jgi:hypothetical protein
MGVAPEGSRSRLRRINRTQNPGNRQVHDLPGARGGNPPALTGIGPSDAAGCSNVAGPPIVISCSRGAA